jgi:hypothetical protein
LNLHYCNEHDTKFYRNERKDYKGDLKVWYSHKMLDGQGFCTEKGLNDLSGKEVQSVKQLTLVDDAPKATGMLMCNAMNNAVALAANGKITTNEIGSYYKKILSELRSTI